jgi:hypothetical protein
MRWVAIALFVAASVAESAPNKEELPPGAIARIGTALAPVKDTVHPGEVQALTFVDDKTLFVGTMSGWRNWDVEKRQSKQEKPIGGAAFASTRDADRLYIGSIRKLHVVEPLQSATFEPAKSLDSTSDAVSVLAIAPGGRRVVFVDGDLKLSVLDTSTGKITGTIELASKPVAASLTANGRVIAVVTRDGAARVYNLASDGKLELSWTKRVARSDRVAAAFSPDGRLFAVSSAGRVMILEAVAGRPMTTIERRFGEGDVRCLTFSPDSRLLGIGTNGPEPIVRISDAITANEYVTGTSHLGDINAVAFTPDGKMLASAGSDTSVMLWKVRVPGAVAAKVTTADDAWDKLDALEADIAFASMGHLLSHPGRAVEVLGNGFKNVDKEQAQIRRWIRELDHDEFRVRETARRNLVKVGLRGAPALTDPKRTPLGAEGEQRVRLILEALESQGQRVPESGMFGDLLRMVRGVRVLELIGGDAAKAVLEDAAKGPAESRLTREAKAALETWPAR